MAGAASVTILLDTCALLWYATDWGQFSSTARRAIADPRVDLAVSAISAFEIGMLERRGRIQLGLDSQNWFAAVVQIGSFHVIPVTWEIAMASARLPLIHKDPADRIIIATAIEFQFSILSPDAHIAAYPAQSVIW